LNEFSGIIPGVGIGMNEYRKRQMDVMDVLEGMQGLSTVVPFSDSFVSDTRLCLTCVAFLDKAFAGAIFESLIAGLQRLSPEHYFYKPSSLHITIQNVRTISDPPRFTENDILCVAREFGRTIQEFGPLELEIDGLLKLPTSLCLRAYCDQTMLELVQRLRENLFKIGLPDDKQYVCQDVVFGNITFCRYSCFPSPEFFELAKKLSGHISRKWVVQEAELITTNAICHPEMTKSRGRFRFQRAVDSVFL
jgi:hypothetical protein